MKIGPGRLEGIGVQERRQKDEENQIRIQRQTRQLWNQTNTETSTHRQDGNGIRRRGAPAETMAIAAKSRTSKMATSDMTLISEADR